MKARHLWVGETAAEQKKKNRIKNRSADDLSTCNRWIYSNKQYYSEIRPTRKKLQVRQSSEKTLGKGALWKQVMIWEKVAREQERDSRKLREKVCKRNALSHIRADKIGKAETVCCFCGLTKQQTKGESTEGKLERNLQWWLHNTRCQCTKECANWKGKLGWTMWHSHLEGKESGWSKKKGKELRKGNEWSGRKLNYFGQGKGMNLSDLYYVDNIIRL